jgi:hypothetical protein
MPRGSGIYEDEPREHRHVYSPESMDQDAHNEDPTPDESASKGSEEPPD